MTTMKQRRNQNTVQQQDDDETQHGPLPLEQLQLEYLIHKGMEVEEGGNIAKRKKHYEPKDQQLIHKKNHVRIIRDYWEATGSVFKLKPRRILGQPELSLKAIEKSKKRGLCNVDISKGKERLPICVVNDLDEEEPPRFTYTAKMIYPDWCRPLPPRSCGCKNRCSESKNCACVAKNGGEMPYNKDGAIIRAKPLVYECGPHCTCPSSCYMRVSQRGIKFQLEIFKTESRGWGVRSRESIPMGSFICEYAGELLEDKQAERLTGKDEYLFNIGNEEDAFTIDAARKGNIGRFINHSCSPNLYAQDVLYDHEEMRIPRVMFFAQDNIPPLEELTWHYNYKIDQM